MAIVQTNVRLPDDAANTGKREDHILLSGGNVREVVTIGSPDADGVALIAPVDAVLGLSVNPTALAPDASTETKQDDIITVLTSIDGKITAVDTDNVTVVASALPTGAATAANQPGLGTAGSPNANVISVQGITSGFPLPISGTVTATVSGVATAANQTNASQKTQIVDGGGNVIGATSNALDINIKSGNPTTIAVTNAGTFLVQAAQSGTWNIGTVSTVTTVSAVTAITNALPAGSNVIGHVITDSGSTTVVTGTVTVAAHAVTIASGGVASGAYASGSIASGAYAAGSIAAGAVAAGATSFVKLEDVASADADAGVACLAVRKATPANTSGTDGDYEFLQMSAGRVWASATIDAALPAGANVIGHIIADTGSTTAVTGNVTVVQGTGTNLHMVVDSGTITTVSAVTAITNALPAGSNVIGHVITDTGSTTVVTGTVTVGTHAVTVASGGIASGAVASGAYASGAYAAGSIAAGAVAAGASSFVKLEDVASADADAGVPALAVRKATPANTSGTDGDYEFLQMSVGRLWVSATVDNALVTTPLFVTTTPSATGGWTIMNATSGDGSTALTNSAQAVKASAGTLGGWYIYNPNASATYVNIYNTASGSVTVGTTNQAMVLCIPATSAANLELTNGINFGTAIAVSATTTGGGNTAPGTALEANFFYK